jgi:hypothetical protein
MWMSVAGMNAALQGLHRSLLYVSKYIEYSATWLSTNCSKTQESLTRQIWELEDGHSCCISNLLKQFRWIISCEVGRRTSADVNWIKGSKDLHRCFEYTNILTNRDRPTASIRAFVLIASRNLRSLMTRSIPLTFLSVYQSN